MEKTNRAAERAEKRRFWGDYLKSWKASDLTQAKYCREHGLNVHNFVCWKKRLLPDRASLIEVPIRLGMGASFPAALDDPGRANTTWSTMWVFRGGDPRRPVTLFLYHPTRSSDVPRKVLSGYRGYLQTDAFSAYEGLEKEMPGIVLVSCFAHVRRNFIKVIETRGKEAKKKPGSAEVALGYIQKLCAIEEIMRASGLSPPERVELRKQRAQPVLDEFKDWLKKRVSQTPPKGLLGKALSYALKNWPKLVRYLENEHITPGNNLAENAIRPFVVGRRNWLFAGHPNGAHAAATLYSPIETAKACGLEPYRYLRYLFEKLPYATCEEGHRSLLPHNVTHEQLADFIGSL